jgi:glycosyltransferase involved in cell wall biosynthesis
MIVDNSQKIGIISHTFPPSPSGQAMVLYRLLNDLPSNIYSLISITNYNTKHSNRASKKLPGAYYHLRPAFQFPTAKRLPKLSALIKVINASIGIYKRAKQLKIIIKNGKINLLLVCTGNLNDLPAASLAGKWTGTPYITYIFDDYAYQWTGVYRYISKLLEPTILKHAKAVIVTNEYMRKEYIKRYGVNSTVIHNPCFLPNLKKLDAAEKTLINKGLNIVYAGAIYHAHYDAFRNLIAAMNLLKRSDLKLHIFTAQSRLELKKNGMLGNFVVYHRHINNTAVPKILREADILFLPLAFDSPIPEVIKTSAPGKTGEYLSVGKPILVHAPQNSFISSFFRENYCGLVVEKKDPIILADEIAKLISNNEMMMEISRNARRASETLFNIDKAKKQLCELVKNIQKQN